VLGTARRHCVRVARPGVAPAGTGFAAGSPLGSELCIVQAGGPSDGSLAVHEPVKSLAEVIKQDMSKGCDIGCLIKPT
jgi:hypothetical protein